MFFCKLKCMGLILFFIMAPFVFAGQAFYGVISSQQPDGEILRIRKVGNEYLHAVMTEDSVLVVRDTAGFWFYADEAGQSTDVRAKNKENRNAEESEVMRRWNPKVFFKNKILQKPAMESSFFDWYYPKSSSSGNKKVETRPSLDLDYTTGEHDVLVILVQFSDVKFNRENPEDEYEKYFNQEGFSKDHMIGSVRDYFLNNSMGLFKPNFKIMPVITLSKKRDRYGSYAYIDRIELGMQDALSEAVDSLIARGINLSAFETDGDDVVDYVHVIFAGPGASDSDVETAIWPHRAFMSPAKRVTSSRLGGRSSAYIYWYSCSGEISGLAYMVNRRTKIMEGIGAAIHEISHQLGLPDIYDSQNSGKVFSPGNWDVMDAGSYNCDDYGFEVASSCKPPNFSAFERYSLGWLEPRILKASDSVQVLKGISENDAFLVKTGKDNDYFFLEYRPNRGMDKALPGHGMLIWHVDFDVTAWNNNMVNIDPEHPHVDLVEADGILTDDTRAGDAFPGGGRNKITDFDGFVSWDNDSARLEIHEVTELDSVVTFRVSGAGLDWDDFSSEMIESSSSMSLLGVEDRVLGNASSSSVVDKFEFLKMGQYVNISVLNGSVHVVAEVSGNKLVQFFDMNGVLLYSMSFEGNEIDVSISSVRNARCVVAMLRTRGKQFVQTISLM